MRKEQRLIGMKVHQATDGARRFRVSVAVKAHEAGLGPPPSSRGSVGEVAHVSRSIGDFLPTFAM